jgi:exosortase/archaeosortase family protein
MNKEAKNILGMFLRYFFILFLGMGNLYIFYKILTPITVFLISKTVGLFTEILVIRNIIFLKDFTVELIPACVAGSAFFLLFLLVFSSANITPKKRILALVISSIALLFLNYIRIIFLILIVNNFYFDLIHWILWHLVSVVFVVGIWFLVVKIFKIKSIPIYTDISYLTGFLKKEKKVKKKNRH